MFPIIDTRGNVIGFGGRVLADEQPKYLNSPDTAAFKKKSMNLFALNFAKNTGGGRLILCEGYMDVISCTRRGSLRRWRRWAPRLQKNSRVSWRAMPKR